MISYRSAPVSRVISSATAFVLPVAEKYTTSILAASSVGSAAGSEDGVSAWDWVADGSVSLFVPLFTPQAVRESNRQIAIIIEIRFFMGIPPVKAFSCC